TASHNTLAIHEVKQCSVRNVSILTSEHTEGEKAILSVCKFYASSFFSRVFKQPTNFFCLIRAISLSVHKILPLPNMLIRSFRRRAWFGVLSPLRSGEDIMQ